MGMFLESPKNDGSDIQLGSTILGLASCHQKIQKQSQSKQGCSIRKLGTYICLTKDFMKLGKSISRDPQNSKVVIYSDQ